MGNLCTSYSILMRKVSIKKKCQLERSEGKVAIRVFQARVGESPEGGRHTAQQHSALPSLQLVARRGGKNQ